MMNTQPVVAVRRVIQEALDLPDVQISPGVDVRHATTRVVQAIEDAPAFAVVEVRPDWKGKTFWTQIIATLAMIATLFGLPISVETQTIILATIIPVVGVLTMVWKRWFTKTVTPQSVGKE